jgi:UDP-N-acetylglucosamine 1-carboxyvinyltransferase
MLVIISFDTFCPFADCLLFRNILECKHKYLYIISKLMSKYIINGQQKISGSIAVAGAKNNALKLLPAALLTDKECIIHNVPDIEDIRILIEMIKELGVEVKKLDNGSYSLQANNINTTDIDVQLAKKLRSSIMLIAPLLGRFKKVTLPHPGGCMIGKRPIDFFIDGFKKFGGEVKFEKEAYYFKADKVKGAKIVFPQISHTGTESMMLAAVLAEGKTEIHNAACEPEVVALAEMLNQMGAKITGAGTHLINIEGVAELQGTEFTVMPDRIETGSFICLAAVNNQELTITNCNPNDLLVPLHIFTKMGVNLEIGKDTIKVGKSKKLNASKITTHEYPGFPTDLQPPMTVLLTQVSGLSLVHETIYESRLLYTDMLNRMGANIIQCDPHRVIVQGPSELFAKKVESPDLRAGIAMVIAATIAEGSTEIDNIYQIERGYQNIVERLRGIGVDITRVED